MKFSKLLKMILGFAGLFNAGIVDGDGGGYTGPLDSNSAADAFSSLLGADGPAESETQQAPAEAESPKAAAERLAKEELAGDAETPEGAADPALEEGAITVEIDGKKVALTKEQIAEAYKNGLRQADYTRKTMEAAEVRKAADAEKAQARQERDAYAQKLQTFALTTQAALQEAAAELTEELAHTDPQEYLIKKHIFDQRQAQLNQAQQEIQHIAAQQQHEQAEAMRHHLETQREQLLAKLPEWKDEAKATADQAAIKKFLAGEGLTDAEIGNITDHRMVLLARKAMQYDALMTRAKDAAKKVAALPVKAERAGSPEVAKPDGRSTAMKQLAKTGSIRDAASAFSQFL